MLNVNMNTCEKFAHVTEKAFDIDKFIEYKIYHFIQAT